MQAIEHDVFTTTRSSRAQQAFSIHPQCEGEGKIGESLLLHRLGNKRRASSRFPAAITPRFTFDERQFKSADAGRFARSVGVRHGSLLKLIDTHRAVFDPASQQFRQLEIRQ